MKVMFPSRILVLTAASMLLNQVLTAQNSTQIFGPVFTRSSPSGLGYTVPPSVFGTTTVSVSCAAGAIPTATLSGPLMLPDGSAPALNSGELQPGGNLLVDNNVLVTVTPIGGVAGPTQNVCVGGANDGQPGTSVPPDLTNNCFNQTYRNNITTISGKNPDTFAIFPSDTPNAQTPDFFGGVAPLNISSLLSGAAGKTVSITVALTDEGGALVSSTIFLQSSCTINGVTGPATVGGNPISSTDSSGTSQSFTFNTANDKIVGFGYDVTGALPNLINNQNGATPQVTDLPLDKTKFQPVYSPATSFATSNCLIHNGEVLADGTTLACKLYTLQCQSPTDGTVKGANCPVSSQVNEVVQDQFDGPPFSLQNIITPYGIFRQGMGFLMASEPWTGGNCGFDPSSGLTGLACPQNLLTSFTGPGKFSGTGLTTNPNSTFLSIYGVPEDFTLALIVGEWPNHWVNTRTPNVKFNTLAPNFGKGAWTLNGSKLVPLPGAASYTPAPIKSLTYGVSPVSSLPNPVNEPIAGDVTLPTAANCSATPFTAKSVPNFSPAAQHLSFSSDGHFLLHYYAQDCAGTQELAFTQDPSGSWMTNFFTNEVNVDTLRPSVVGLAVPAPGTIKKGTTQYATYTCTDDPSGAGVVLCGTSIFGTESTYTTNTLKTKLDTGSVGTKSLTINALDGAGNLSSASVSYTVTK